MADANIQLPVVEPPAEREVSDVNNALFVVATTANDEIPIPEPSPPQTPRLEPTTQGPDTDVEVLVLGSPHSSESSLSPPPSTFGSRSLFSSPGPSAGPLASAQLHNETKGQSDGDHQSESDQWETDQSDTDQTESEAEQDQDEEATGPSATTTRANTRNTTDQAKDKARKILEGGVPHPKGKCDGCVRGKHDCIVNSAVSNGNTCAKCAKHKEKCSHQQKEDGRIIRANGSKVKPRPCTNCAKKAKQGLPAECYRVGKFNRQNLGTACSQCMIDGDVKTCSEKAKQDKAKPRKNKTKALKNKASS